MSKRSRLRNEAWTELLGFYGVDHPISESETTSCLCNKYAILNTGAICSCHSKYLANPSTSDDDQDQDICRQLNLHIRVNEKTSLRRTAVERICHTKAAR